MDEIKLPMDVWEISLVLDGVPEKTWIIELPAGQLPFSPQPEAQPDDGAKSERK